MVFDGCFVTGTDTGVGKTLVSAALLHTLARHHRRVVGMKPVAAGLVAHQGGWVSEDVLALRAASTVAVPADLDNPVALPDALAPHLAAGRAGRAVTVAELLAAHRALKEHADVVVVEGAGGWRVPLNDRSSAGPAAADQGHREGLDRAGKHQGIQGLLTGHAQQSGRLGVQHHEIGSVP